MKYNFKIDKERDLIVAFTNPLEVNDEEVEEQFEKVVEKFVEDFGHRIY